VPLQTQQTAHGGTPQKTLVTDQLSQTDCALREPLSGVQQILGWSSPLELTPQARREIRFPCDRSQDVRLLIYRDFKFLTASAVRMSLGVIGSGDERTDFGFTYSVHDEVICLGGKKVETPRNRFVREGCEELAVNRRV
jgi:hypothetical protein